MKIVLNIVKFILITCLTICLILDIYAKVFSSTILSKEYTLSQLEENNYYEEIYNEIKSNFEKYIAQSGLDEEILNNIVTKDMIKSDINKLINSAYEGKTSYIDTESLRQNLTKNIEESLENTYISSTTQSSIDEFIDKIVKEYEDTMLHSKYIKNINTMYERVIELIEILKTALIVGIVIFVVLLIILNIKKIYKFIYNIGIAGLSTGLFIGITNIIIKAKVKIEYVKIFNDAISKVLIGIINSIIENLNNISVIFIIVSVILIVISAIIQSKRKTDKH